MEDAVTRHEQCHDRSTTAEPLPTEPLEPWPEADYIIDEYYNISVYIEFD